MAGFSRKIGIVTSLLAELWAIRDGLMLCIDCNLTMVEVELDAKTIVHLLANPLYSNCPLFPILFFSFSFFFFLWQLFPILCFKFFF